MRMAGTDMLGTNAGAAMKTLNIGVIGCGFMGRTHSNAFRQAERFFDLPYRPVLKAVCARNAERAAGVRGAMGLRHVRDGLAEDGGIARD